MKHKFALEEMTDKTVEVEGLSSMVARESVFDQRNRSERPGAKEKVLVFNSANSLILFEAPLGVGKIEGVYPNCQQSNQRDCCGCLNSASPPL